LLPPLLGFSQTDYLLDSFFHAVDLIKSKRCASRKKGFKSRWFEFHTDHFLHKLQRKKQFLQFISFNFNQVYFYELFYIFCHAAGQGGLI